MKKILTLIVALAMVFSVSYAVPVVAMAKTVESPTAPVNFKPADPIYNNGGNVTITQDPDDQYKITITIDPNSGYSIGDVKIPGVEGVDYNIISEDGGVYVIEVLNPSVFEEQGIETVFKSKNGGTTTVKKPIKHDNGSNAPKTGAVNPMLASFAVAGAGIAAVAVLKKKNNKE